MEFSVNNYINQHNKVISSLDIHEVERALEIIKHTMVNGNRIATCGNGGSALAASHFITDWNKMIFSQKNICFNGISLVDNIGLITAYSNDLSYEHVFSEQVKNLLKEGDLLITVTGSGNSRNILQATEVANSMGVNTLTICGFDGGRIRKIANNYVWIRSMDMQICEDAHVIFGHMVMKYLCEEGINT